MRLSPLVGLLVASPLVVACTQNTATDRGDARSVAVSSTDDACRLSATRAPAGPLTFDVTNDGSAVTEFYLLAPDGRTVLGEVENIGPGLRRQLVVRAAAGSYVAQCKPGMKGDGIRSDFTVTPADETAAGPAGSSGTAAGRDHERVERAEAAYGTYVQAQSDLLLAKTTRFVTAYKAGQDRRARALYADARTHWERIETVAESFGDLDPRMDAREADLEPGQKWTGWHRIEKDLWPARAEQYAALGPAQRAAYADDLLRDTGTLDRRIGKLTFTVDQVANGSRGLMEEVANGKVTGEEEYWSRTDLWDFQANVDGARVAFEVLRPLLRERDPGLAGTLAARFAALQQLLDEQRVGAGFRSYDEVSPAEIRSLAAAVNALAEPLSEVTAAVIS